MQILQTVLTKPKRLRLGNCLPVMFTDHLLMVFKQLKMYITTVFINKWKNPKDIMLQWISEMSHRKWNMAQWNVICCVSQALADSTKVVCDLERIITSFSTRKCRNELPPSLSPLLFFFIGRESVRWAASVQILTVYGSTIWRRLSQRPK